MHHHYQNLLSLSNKLMIFMVMILFSINTISAQSQLSGRVISADDDSPLPYASIFTKSGKFAFSNDGGYFTLKGRIGEEVTITFLGFRDTTLVLSEQYMIIKMKNDGIVTDEVIITDQNYISPYKTLAKARKAYKKEDGDEIKTKLFVKRESINNGEWADQTEVLYNYKHKNRRIYDWRFKHGKSHVNVENDLIFTLDLFDVMKQDWIFDKTVNSLYPSIISHSSAKKMVKNYEASYAEYTSNGKDYFVITSTPIEKGASFSSKITVEKETNDFVEIKNIIENPTKVNFRSIRTGKPIKMTRMEFRYSFKQYKEMTFLSHIDVSYVYILNGVESVNNLAFHFYDYGNPFLENVTNIDYQPLTDYQKVWVTPYSVDFWEEQNIVESRLDTLTDYQYLSSKVKSLLEDKPYLTLKNIEVAGEEVLLHIPRMDDGRETDFVVDLMNVKTQLHLSAFFHVNPYRKENTLKYEVTPLIHYSRSFIYNTTPLILLQLEREIAVIREQTKKYQTKLYELSANRELTDNELEDLSDEQHQNLWRALSKLDVYQFTNWSPYNHHEALKGKMRARF